MSASKLRGILVDYEYCTGCHSCEVACKKLHGFEQGQCGMHVMQIGPFSKPDGKWEYDYVPVPGDLCDLCETRLAQGKLPTCVHHCQALVLTYGTVEELSRCIDKPKMSLFVPGAQ